MGRNPVQKAKPGEYAQNFSVVIENMDQKMVEI